MKKQSLMRDTCVLTVLALLAAVCSVTSAVMSFCWESSVAEAVDSVWQVLPFFLGYSLLLAAVLLLLSRKDLPQSKYLCIALCAVPFVLSVDALLMYYGNYRYAPFIYLNLYVPAFMGLVLFLLPLLFENRRFNPLIKTALFVGVCGIIPFFILGAGMDSYPVAALMLLLVFILSVKMYREKVLGKKIFRIILLVLGVLVCIAAASLARYSELFVSRLQVAVTRGECDPYGVGWQLSQFYKALYTAEPFGMASYLYLGKNAWVSLPQMGDTGLIRLMLAAGWGTALLLLCFIILLCAVLFVLSAKCRKKGARYFTFGVGVLFSLRMVLAVFITFYFPMQGIFLPFFGNLSVAMADTLLLTAAFVLCMQARGEESNRALILPFSVEEEQQTVTQE